MRTLIYGTSYVEGQEARYVFGLWEKLVTKLNPNCDILVVDSASPDLPKTDLKTIQLGDNIGHLMKTGRDGWGRAFVKGLEYAWVEQYDYAVHIECDLLLAKPVMPVIKNMAKHKIKASCPPASPYSMVETAIMFMDLSWPHWIPHFVEEYGWETAPVMPLAEMRVTEILGDWLWLVPWRGYRNDTRVMTARNMKTMFPAGIEWITHADAVVYREFLRTNGLGD